MSVGKSTVRENIEWSNMRWNNAPNKSMERILLVGDSIVVGHEKLLHDIISNNYCIDSFATAKCVSDIDYMKELNYMLSTNDYSLVIFNNGLHGFEVKDKDYEDNLKEVLTDLKQRVKNIIWRSSTPMLNKEDLTKLDDLRTPTILKRNQFAKKVAKELEIPILDLYTPMSENLHLFSPDAVHYSEEGKIFQAKFIADFIADFKKIDLSS